MIKKQLFKHTILLALETNTFFCVSSPHCNCLSGVFLSQLLATCACIFRMKTSSQPFSLPPALLQNLLNSHPRSLLPLCPVHTVQPALSSVFTICFSNSYDTEITWLSEVQPFQYCKVSLGRIWKRWLCGSAWWNWPANMVCERESSLEGFSKAHSLDQMFSWDWKWRIKSQPSFSAETQARLQPRRENRVMVCSVM